MKLTEILKEAGLDTEKHGFKMDFFKTNRFVPSKYMSDKDEWKAACIDARKILPIGSTIKIGGEEAVITDYLTNSILLGEIELFSFDIAENLNDMEVVK